MQDVPHPYKLPRNIWPYVYPLHHARASDCRAAPMQARSARGVDAVPVVTIAQSRAQRKFSQLRNSTIAHRDRDAIRQYRDIVAIDGREVTRIAADFYLGTDKFLEILPKLLEHSATWPGMLEQLRSQAARKGSLG